MNIFYKSESFSQLKRMGPLGPLPSEVMGHILKSWDNGLGPSINLKASTCILTAPYPSQKGIYHLTQCLISLIRKDFYGGFFIFFIIFENDNATVI